MTDSPLLLVSMVLLALLIGCVLGWLLGRSRERVRLGLEPARLEAQLAGAREAIARADAEAERARVELAETRRDQAQRLAIEAQQRDADHRVLEAIAPVKQQLDHMRRTVAAMEEQRLHQHGELAEQIRRQLESDDRLRETTGALAAALRSNSARGSWGEAQLRNIVEAAGLTHRVDFAEQVAVTTEAGARRPDLVIHLPGDGCIAVDAKAPLADYLAACDIAETGSDAERREREQRLANHAKAVRSHVTKLAERDYASAFPTSPAFVIAFLPAEAALSAALRADPSLLDDAFAKGVALTSPVSLWSTLKAVSSAWRQQQMADEAAAVIALGAQLTGRLATLTSHFERLGRSLSGSVTAYNAAIGSLESRVGPAARKLAALSEAPAPKALESLEDAVRGVTPTTADD